MKIYESAEDYLERILILKEKNGYVRSIDLANDMCFSKPSISVAMKKLRENGYITSDKDGLLFLTEKGMKIASETYEKHVVLTKILMDLGVEEEVAKNDACRIEHCISKESFNALKKHFNSKI